LRTLAGRCQAKDPADRPAPAPVVAECQRHLAAETAEPAGAPGMARAAPPWLPPDIAAILAGLAAVAVLATAGVVATLAFTGQPGASSGHPRPTGSARLQHTLRATAPASPKPTLPSTIDSCVVGTWIATTADTTLNYGTVQVQLVSHHGPVEIDRPDGTLIEKYGSGTVYTGSYQGISWTDTFRGHATMHYEDRNGVVYLSHIAPNGQWTLLKDGVYNNSGALGIEAAPYHYSCGRRTMREFFSTGSIEYRREDVASRPTGS
jgi:hypothetical protein